MAIVKGFLRPKITYDPKYLVVGLFIGTLFSYLFYKFFYYFREIYRILIYHFGDGGILELTEKEHFIYNIFYGSISAMLGLYIALIFCLDNSIDFSNKKSRISQRTVLNDQKFFLWGFINAFFRMAWLIGFLFITIPLHLEMDFLRDYTLLLILVPVVFFLGLWPTLIRKTGNKGYKWMLYAFAYVLVLTVLFSNINRTDFLKIDRMLRKSDVIYAYDLKIPSTNSFKQVQKPYLATNLYYVEDTCYFPQPFFFVENKHNYIGFEDIMIFVAREKDKLSESLRNEIVFNLFFDQSTELVWINKLKNELRRAGANNIQYSTNLMHSKYSPNSPQLKYIGLQQTLAPIYSRWFTHFLDSAERLDPKRNILKLPNSRAYRVHKIKNSKFIIIAVTNDRVILNYKPIDDDELKVVLYKFIKNHSPDYNIIFVPHEQITFGRYIHYLDMMYSTIDKLRNELSIIMYNTHFDEYSDFYSANIESILLNYPETSLNYLMRKKGCWNW